jgi:16S rRNA (uracil1498-N3)-methyltransferase
MRLTRIYFSEPLAKDRSVLLPKEASHYLANVLRLRAGDAILLFNESNGEFLATINKVSKGGVSAEVAAQHRAPASSEVSIELGLGLSKGDRMDYGIQKSVEMGVAAITPVNCKFGEVRFKQAARVENKLRHWRRVAVSATEQSGRMDVAAVEAPRNLSDWLASVKASTRICLDPGAETRLGDQPLSSSVAILIGPEGGLSEAELAQANSSGFTHVTLGPRILRTETAPVAALAVVQHLLGN